MKGHEDRKVKVLGARRHIIIHLTMLKTKKYFRSQEMAEEEEEAKRDQPRILRSFATENKETKEWTVDEPIMSSTEVTRIIFHQEFR